MAGWTPSAASRDARRDEPVHDTGSRPVESGRALLVRGHERVGEAVKTRTWALGLFLALSVMAAACGGDDAADTATEAAGGAISEGTEAVGGAVSEGSEAASGAASEGSEAAAGSEGAATATGPGCAAIPAEGEGSLSGMADDPTATAASNNPVLSTLVSAVMAADLVDTLNDTSMMYTVFAPSNDAFAKIPPADLEAVLADTDLLSQILTLHVHGGEALSGEELASMTSLSTVNGAEITLAAEGETLMVNGQASVICQDIQTANSRVHIIDTVMMPAAG